MQRGGPVQTPERTLAADSPQAEQQPDEAAPRVQRRLVSRLNPTDILALQRTVGNRAVGRLMAGAGAEKLLQRVLEPDGSWGWQAWPINPNSQTWNDINTEFNRIPGLRNQLQALQHPTFDGSPAFQQLDGILGALHGKYDPQGVTISLQRATALLPILRTHNANADALIAGVPAQQQLQLQQEQTALGLLRNRLGAPLQGLGFVPANEGINDALRTNLQQQLLQHTQANQRLGRQALAQLTQSTVQIEQQYQQTAQRVQVRTQRLAAIDQSTELADTLQAIITQLAPGADAITDRRPALLAEVARLLQLRADVLQAPLDPAVFQQRFQLCQAALQQLQADVEQDAQNTLGAAVHTLRQNLSGLDQRMLSQGEIGQRNARRHALQQLQQTAQQFTAANYAQLQSVLDALAQGRAFLLQANQRIGELQNLAVVPAVPNQVAGVNAGDLFEGLHAPAQISAVTTYIQAHQAQVEALLPIYEPGLIRQMAADNVVDAKWFTILPTLRQDDWGHAPDVSADLDGAVGQVPVDVEWNHILQVHVNRYATDNGIQDHSFNARTSFWRDPNATIDDIAAAITACIEDAALQANVRARYQANANHRLAAVTINNYRIGVRIVQGAAQGTVTVGQFYDNSIAPADSFSQEESVQLSQYMGFKR